MPKRVRSLEGRRRGRARFRASKRARNISGVNPVGTLGAGHTIKEGGATTYWDSCVPSDDWDTHVEQVQGCPEEDVSLMDGSGLPHMGHWAKEPYSMDKAADPQTTKRLSAAVSQVAQDWLSQPGASDFIESFLNLDDKSQSSLAHLWDSFGISDYGRDLSRKLALILEEQGYGFSSTLLQDATERSPLKGRLLEAVLRCSAPKQVVDDLAGATNVMGGAQAGISIPSMVENSDVWPAFVKKPKRRGEPDGMILWDGKPQDSYNLQGDLAPLALEKIQEEIEDKRMEAISFEEARHRGAKAITSLKAIWKNQERTKVRMISDYRRSGINKEVCMETTTALPRLKEIARFVTDCADGRGEEGRRPLGYMLKYDIRGAYRLIDLRECERMNTAVADPRPQGEVLWDVCLPFGLSSSCLIFSRYNSGIHRTQYRLVGCIGGHGGGLCYIDDSIWWTGSLVEIISLLLLPLAFGMELEYSKIAISGSSVEFLGYELGLRSSIGQKGVIALPKQKRDLIRSMIHDARKAGFITRKDLEVLLGRLNFACQLVVEHKPRLSGLYAALAIMNKLELRKRSIGGDLEQAMIYFYDVLSSPFVMEPAMMVEPQWSVITDGCLHGLGGLVVGPDTSTRAWFSVSRSDYPQLWKDILLVKRRWAGQQCQVEDSGQSVPSVASGKPVSGDICFIEAVAAVCGIFAVERLLEDRDPSRTRIRCFSDNQAVSSLVRKWTSKTAAMRHILGWVSSWAGRVSGCYIPGQYNTAADKLSRSDHKDIVPKVPQAWKEVEVVDALRSCINPGCGE